MSAMTPLLQVTDRGLYCSGGDFFIDPWQPVTRALITHGHGDHARPGSTHYLTARPGVGILRLRLDEDADVEGIPFGERLDLGGVGVSFHPAGHILGSAQIRLEHRGEVWVVSGDYKTSPDPTSAPFEPLRCHVFVSESTFGLPIYRWPSEEEIMAEIHAWWRDNQEAGRASLLFAYALGKAQRLLARLDPAQGPILGHGAVETMNHVYRESGVFLPPTLHATEVTDRELLSRAIVLAPPSAQRSPWLRRFGDLGTAFVSGWMLVRGARRRRVVDRGFVLSDHADWDGLLGAIRATGAVRVLLTHGHTLPMARFLREQGLDASVLETQFEGELDDGATERDA